MTFSASKPVPPRKVYLAGPDVFLPNAREHFDHLQSLCKALGLQGLVPSDGGLSQGFQGSRHELASTIYRENIALIESADAVLANLCAFRNPVEPDSGTAFEVGFAVARGKPVVGYLPQAAEFYEHRVEAAFGVRTRSGLPFDATHDYLIEAMDLPLNLMLACSTPLHATAASALAALAERLHR